MSTNDFALIDPPADLKPVKPGRRWSDIRVDYASHPAYRAFANADFGRRARATGEFLRRAGLLLAKRAIRYEMIPLDYRKPRAPAELLQFSVTAIRNMVSPRRRPRDIAGVEGSAGAIAQRIKRDGVLAVQISPETFAELERAATPAFEELRERRRRSHNGRRAFDDSRRTLNRTAAPELYAALERVLNSSGIMGAASAVLGRTAQLVDVNPQINDPSDSFWRDIFPDLELEKIPAASYFHRDASGGDLKAIFYFPDVGPQNGPFSYAVGSNNMEISVIDDLISETNDHGLSATDPSTRAKFAVLPRLFQQKGTFGNDLPDDSEFAREVIDSTWSITGPKGSIVLFDTKGTHRGGMVEQGERMVVTCVIG